MPPTTRSTHEVMMEQIAIANEKSAGPPRPEPRAPQRPEQRVAPRQRLLKNNDRSPFEIDPDLIPPGQSWEWKRQDIYGWKDRTSQINDRLNGWMPVPARVYYARTPHIMEQMGIGPDDPVEQGGQMLMERPIELTAEAMAEEKVKADAQFSDKMNQLSVTPQGTMQRTQAVVKRQHGNTIEVTDT